MSDLSSMIDDTTERLLKKVDNWKIPQSDKKYIRIEKEVWESTLKASMDRAGKIEVLEDERERLQKQLDMAVTGLQYYANEDIYIEEHKVVNGNNEWTSEVMLDNGAKASYYLKNIKELNK